MFGGKAAFGKGGAHLILAVAGKLLPDFLDTGGSDALIHFLLKVADGEVVALLHRPADGWDKSQDTFEESGLTDSVGSGENNFLSPFHGKS